MSEQHQYFPSGTWEGVYKYPSEHDGSRHEMHFTLDFANGVVTGSGGDDVGGFSWRGTYDTDTFAVAMTKSYVTHNVYYKGMADENGIYGRWDLLTAQQVDRLKNVFGDNWSNSFEGLTETSHGGFHLWPRKGEEEAVEKAVEAIEMVISPKPVASGIRRADPLPRN